MDSGYPVCLVALNTPLSEPSAFKLQTRPFGQFRPRVVRTLRVRTQLRTYVYVRTYYIEMCRPSTKDSRVVDVMGLVGAKSQ